MNARVNNLLLLSMAALAFGACEEATSPPVNGDALQAPHRAPPGISSMLWGSSSASPTNPGSIFTIDEVSGAATLVGHHGFPSGHDRLAAIDFDPVTEVLYAIKGGPCYGALLLTIDPTTGAGTLVDTLMSGWFDGTPGVTTCAGGASAIAFDADGNLYASGWYGGTPQGKLMKVDKTTGAVLEVYPTPVGYDDWRGRRIHYNGLAFDANGTLWASRGYSTTAPQINTVDPATGAVTGTLYLNDPVMTDSLTISDLTFGSDGVLYASLPWESVLATIDTTTGDVTRIGSYGAAVTQIAGLATLPRTMYSLLGRYWFNEAGSGQGPTLVLDDQANPIDLTITYSLDLNWATVGGHIGLQSTGTNHAGIAYAAVIGSKYDTGLTGSTEGTFVVVAEWTAAPHVAPIAGFQTISDNRKAAVLASDVAGRPQAMFTTDMQTSIQVVWPVALGDATRRVLHLIYDSNQAVAADRIRLYVDGVDQGAAAILIGTLPALGETLKLSDTGMELHVANRNKKQYRPMLGTVFYYAAYNAALTDAEITTNATDLLADDDTPP
jgi:hypothetical protein